MIQPNADLLSAGCSCSRQPAAPALRRAPTSSTRREWSDSACDKAALLALVQRANADDSAAQAELVHRYTRRIAGFVRTIIRQEDAIEDVTQTVFIKMFRRLGRLRDPAVFESWLFTLARNTSLDFLRRRRCRPNTVALDDEVFQIADPSVSDASAEILTALDHALARLSPLDRTLVTQFVTGESYQAIAARVGLSLSAVKVRLHRVRPFLRTAVGEMTGARTRGSKGWRCLSSNRSTFAWPDSSSHASARKAA